MTDRTRFDQAVRDLSQSIDPRASLCAPFMSVLPVTGVSISVLGGVAGPATVCSSDRQATRLDELQFDLGEGPCWQALASRRPVLTEDIRAPAPSDAWPTLVSALSDERVTSIFAFPLSVGSLGIGAVDLYTVEPSRLAEIDVADATTLASYAAWQVLRRVLDDQESPEDSRMEAPESSRREFHQATGMVLAQMGIAAVDAALLIRAHAYSTGRTVIEVSRDIVDRSLLFSEEMP
jgi:GAF domain-containing protein